MKAIDPSNSIFEDLISRENLYVDKTKYLYNLITDRKKYHFLSRPRRFGKSLTLSTLDAIFRGKKELFKGLYIDSTDYDWKEYSVIHINFSEIKFKSADELEKKILNMLLKIARRNCVEVPDEYAYDEVLKYIIEELSEKEKVAILIDEYDSPLNNYVKSDDIEEIRDVLRGFYSVIKASDAYIHFCLITGVTKFSKMSIFSAMNNLIDISMAEEYSTAFGYTQKELEDNFAEYIEAGIKNSGYSR